MNIRFLTLSILLVVFTGISSYAQLFRSANDGNWSDYSIWQRSVDGGSNWYMAPHPPDYSNSTNIQIRSGDSIYVNTDVTIDQAVIDAGGFLRTDATLSINDGASTDLVVNGILTINSTINNNGQVTISNGRADWISGYFNGGGTFTISGAGQCALLTNSNDKRLSNGQTLTNNGNLIWGNSYFYLGENAVIVNNGTIDIDQSNDYSVSCSGVGNSLTNNGTIYFDNSTGAAFSLYVPFTQNGTLRTQSGLFRVGGGGSSGGGFVTAGGASLHFVGNYSVESGTSFTGQGNIGIYSCTVNFGTDITFNKLYAEGATLNGTGKIDISGLFTWQGGYINLNAGFTIASAAACSLITGSTKYLVGSTPFVNAGTLEWTAGSVYLYDNAVLRNTGTLNYTSAADNGIHDGSGSGNRTFENQGTFNKTVSAQFVIYVPNLNTGTYSIQAGTMHIGSNGSSKGAINISGGALLRINTGEFIIDTGAVINNAGTFDVPGGTVNFRTPSINVNNINLTGGTFAGNGAVTITNSLYWANGIIQTANTFIIGSSATATLELGYTKTVRGQTQFVNNGTVNWSNGSLYLYDEAVFKNNGAVNYSSTVDNHIADGNGTGLPRWENTGTLNKNGSGGLSVYAGNYNSGTIHVLAGTLHIGANGTTRGTITIAANSLLRIQTNEYIIDTNAAITNAGTLDVPSGTLTFRIPTITIDNINLTGGTFAGQGVVTISNAMYYSQGIVQTSGGFNIGPAATLTIAGGGSKNINTGGAFINNGTTNWTGGAILLYDNVIFRNNGTLNCTTNYDNSLSDGNSGSHSFENNGVLNKYGGAWLSFYVPVANYGTLNVAAGNAAFHGNGTSKGSLNVSSGALLRFQASNFQIDTGSVINNNGTIDLPGGTLSFSAPSTGIKQLSLTGGTIAGSGSVTVTEAFYWTNGSIICSGNFNIAAACTAAITESPAKSLRQQARFINNGTVNWTNGTILFYDGAVVRNYGSLNISTGVDFSFSDGGGSGERYFANHGTLNKAGNAWFTFAITNYNYGSVNIQNGNAQFTYNGTSRGTFNISADALLRFYTGAYTIDTGAVITNAGTLDIPGGSVVFSIPSITFAQLSLNGGTVSGAGSVAISNSFSWSTGIIRNSGTFTLNSTSVSSIAGSSAKSLQQQVVFTNNGTVHWSDGAIILSDGAVFRNNGTLNYTYTYDQSITDGGGSGDRKFLNYGTVNKNSPNWLTLNIWSYNYGTFNLLNGNAQVTYPSLWKGSTNISSAANLRFAANAVTVDTGALFSGAGYLEVNGVCTFRNPETTVPNLSFYGGTINGTGSLSLSGNFYFEQGTLSLSNIATIRPGATLTFSGSYTKGIGGPCSLYILGTANWNNGNIALSDDAKIINAGTWTASGGYDRSIYYGGGSGSAYFQNDGQYTKSASAYTVFGVPVYHSGSMTVSVGDVYFQAGGSATGSFQPAVNTNFIFQSQPFTLNQGVSVTGAGKLKINGSAITASMDSLQMENLELSGGSLTGPATIIVDSTFNWSSGELKGTGKLTLGANCTTSLYGETKNLREQRVLENYGTLNWSGGHIYFYNSPVLKNYGTLNCAFSSDFAILSGDKDGGKVVENYGSMNKYGNYNLEHSIPFNNSGVLRLHNGTMTIYGGVSNGTFGVKKDATLYFRNQQHRLLDGTRFSDSGWTHMANNASVICEGNVTGVMIDTIAKVNLQSNSLIVTGKLNVYGALHCWTYPVTGGGSFFLHPGAMLVSGHSAGITAADADGSIQTTVRNYSPQAVYCYNGPAYQVTGNGLPSTVRGLWIENGNGVSLSGGCTITDAVILNGGRLYVLGAADTLTFGNSCVVSGTPAVSKMVVATAGKVRKLFNAPGTFTFPIGEETGTAEYSPVRVSFASGVFSGGSVTAQVVNERFAQNSSPNHYLTRYWTLTPAGISEYSCNVKCFYADADVHGTESEIVTAKWVPSFWQAYEPANTVENSLSANNVFLLSTFTGAEGAFVRDTTYLDLTVLTEGFYDEILNKMAMRDTFAVVLKEAVSPHRTIDSARAVIDSVTFSGRAAFTNAPTGTYYIAVMHRNSVETWSKSGGEAVTRGGTSAYNFTAAAPRAYGDNMVLKGTKWCLYGGDSNQDGIVDFSDLVLVDNDSYNFVEGYVPTDLNGDNFVDFSDLALCDNNSFNFIGVVKPGAKRAPTQKSAVRKTND